jgi:hypothetical protein
VTPYNRRDLFKTFGSSALFLYPLLSSREVNGQIAVKKRFVCFSSCAGVIQNDFWPKGDGNNFSFDGTSLEPLKSFKSKMNIVRGLDNDYGPFDSHSGGTVSLLTGNYINKSTCVDNYCDAFFGDIAAQGPSIDQMIAARIKGGTPVPSLELAVFPTAERASRYISFNEKGKIMKQMVDPYEVFDNVFKDLVSGCSSTNATGEAELNRIKARRKSILDSIVEDLKSARKKTGLNPGELAKLDSYLQNVREIETRVDSLKVNNAASCLSVKSFLNENDRIEIRQSNYSQVARLMIELIAAAFELDITRVATMVWDVGGAGGVPSTWAQFNGKPINEGYHDLTHQVADPVNWQEKCKVLDKYHAGEFAYLLSLMAKVKEGNSTLLDNSLALWTSEMGNGAAHDPRNIPIVLAGSAASAIKTDRYIDAGADRKYQRLLISILKAFDFKDQNSIGRSGNVQGIL